MIKKILIISLMVLFSIAGFSQDEGSDNGKTKTDVPERIKISLDGLLATRTSNGVYNLRLLDTYYYVLQKSVFVNVLFTADLDASIETLENGLKEKYEAEQLKYDEYVAEMEKKTAEENKSIEEKNKKIKDESKKIALKVFKKPTPPFFKKRPSFHNLYLRVVKDGKESQKFKSFIPYDGSEKASYFSFGLILEPGKYDLLISVDAYDNSEDGTLLAEIEVPELTLTDILAPKSKIEITRPVFYKTVLTLTEAENRFTVLKDSYQIGLIKQEFEPYTGDSYSFKSGDEPVLTFFMMGTSMIQKNPPWDLTANITLMSGEKKIMEFKPIKLENPYFYQPLRLSGKNNDKLPGGSYSIRIIITDNNKQGLNGEVVIPFNIVE